MDVENNATSDTLRDDIAAAFSGDDAGANEVVADAAIPDDRTRDDQGRYAKKEEAAIEVKDDSNEQVAKPEPIVPSKKAPQSWRQEIKAHFDALPPEVQDEIIRRESDFNKGIQKYAEDAKYAQSLRPVFEQWMPYLSSLKISPEQAFTSLINSEYTLRNGSPLQKQQALMTLAQSYGIDLGYQQQDQAAVDPNVQQAFSRVQQLEQYIHNLEYNKQQEAARQQQAEQADLLRQIQEFSNGSSAPHFEQVREDMAQLLSAGYANTLEDAYEKAIWANPDIRASLLKSEEAKRIQEKAELANKAKAKALSVTGSPSGAAVPIVGASIRDDLKAAFGNQGRL